MKQKNTFCCKSTLLYSNSTVPVVLLAPPQKKTIYFRPRPPSYYALKEREWQDFFRIRTKNHATRTRRTQRTTTTTTKHKTTTDNHNFINHQSAKANKITLVYCTGPGPVLYCITLPFHTVGITVLYASNN
jgi:hypothetical protein